MQLLGEIGRSAKLRAEVAELLGTTRDSGAARALAMGVKLAMERPPGGVEFPTERKPVIFPKFTFGGSILGPGWDVLSLGWAR